MHHSTRCGKGHCSKDIQKMHPAALSRISQQLRSPDRDKSFPQLSVFPVQMKLHINTQHWCLHRWNQPAKFPTSAKMEGKSNRMEHRDQLMLSSLTEKL